jgi:hypothetical protein
MNPVDALTRKTADVRKVLTGLQSWPDHLSGRLRKKLVSFDQKIAKFPQRRWA